MIVDTFLHKKDSNPHDHKKRRSLKFLSTVHYGQNTNCDMCIDLVHLCVLGLWRAWELLRCVREKLLWKDWELNDDESLQNLITPHVIATAVMPPRKLRTFDGIPAQCDSKFGK